MALHIVPHQYSWGDNYHMQTSPTTGDHPNYHQDQEKNNKVCSPGFEQSFLTTHLFKGDLQRSILIIVVLYKNKLWISLKYNTKEYLCSLPASMLHS